jgi:TPR repeat protein
MHLGTLSVYVFLSLFAPPAIAASAVTNCDRLAASPDDPKRNAPAVDIIDSSKAGAAEAACRSASKASPDVARFQYQLGRALEAQDSYDAAMAAYQAAFEKGYAAAADAIGQLYELGLGRDVDYRKAAEFYQRALGAGDVFAATDLGLLRQDGKGFEKNPEAAAALYRKAAEVGYAPAEVDLGYLYEYGSGVEKDARQAVDWYRKAADLGYPTGEYDLALMYADGSGVEKNIVEAMRLLRLAADKGDGASILELARYARDGTGAAVDKSQAEKLFRQVIDNGDDDTVWQAEGELALMLAEDGKNLEEATELASKAVAALPDAGEDRSSALDTSAWVSHLRHDDAKALPLAEQAVKGDGQYAPYHDHLGDILLALGHKDRAATEWQKALDLAPPDPGNDWDRNAVVKKLAAFTSDNAQEQSAADPTAPTISPPK